ncbi:MAG TPA: M48 family metallopeptidase [Vicinamibacterales bacterium]
MTVADEVKLGREAQQQLRAQLPRVHGGIASYVSSIGGRLAAEARGPRYPYSFSIADYRDINAFALPGGPIWINRGALDAATSESQLAGVLAHEVAHVARRHAADQISKGIIANGLLGLLGAMLGNAGGAPTAQAGAQLLAGGYLMTFSRDDERDADRAGIEIMRRAGWDPHGLVEFLDTLRRRSGRDPSSVEVFLSTHPSPAERVADLRAALTKSPPHGTRDSHAFRTMKIALARLPPATRMPKP